MDSMHREPPQYDPRMGRDCQFCRSADPEFSKRPAMDRLVQWKMPDTASAHFTEDGYVRHRIAELMKRRARADEAFLLRSA